MKMTARIATLFVVAALAIPVARASADDTKAKKIQGMIRIAMEDFDLGEYASAAKQLEAAVAAAKDAKLEKHPVVVVAYLSLGAVQGLGLKDGPKAVASFRAALAIDPQASLPTDLQKPDLVKLFDEAKSAAEPKKPEAPAQDGPVQGIVHAPVDAAKEGEAIAIEAKVGDDLKAKDVTLYFRAQGSDKYVLVLMKKGGAQRYLAEIPAEATSTDSVQYYIDVKNAKAKLVAAKGNASQPFSISITRIRKENDPAADEPEDDENPLLKYK